MSWKLWTVVVLLGLLGIFALQNTQLVQVRFLFWKIEMSRALVLLGVLGSGLVAGWLLGTLRRGRA
jgi:uncharacterized integral membrane protein